MLGSGGETGHIRTWELDGPRRASYPRLGDWTLFSCTEENKRITFAFQDDQLGSFQQLKWGESCGLRGLGRHLGCYVQKHSVVEMNHLIIDGFCVLSFILLLSLGG